MHLINSVCILYGADMADNLLQSTCMQMQEVTVCRINNGDQIYIRDWGPSNCLVGRLQPDIYGLSAVNYAIPSAAAVAVPPPSIWMTTCLEYASRFATYSSETSPIAPRG